MALFHSHPLICSFLGPVPAFPFRSWNACPAPPLTQPARLFLLAYELFPAPWTLSSIHNLLESDLSDSDVLSQVL